MLANLLEEEKAYLESMKNNKDFESLMGIPDKK